MATQTRTPGTVTSDSTVGTLSWSGTGNVAVDDGSYATATLPAASGAGQSHYLRCTNFGFSIPNGSTVTSVVATVRRLGSNVDGLDNYILDGSVKQYYVGYTGGELADPAYWDSEAAINYTIAENSPGVINSASWGLGVSASFTNGLMSGDVIAQIDLVSITVTYTEPEFPPVIDTAGNQSSGAILLMMLAVLLAFGRILSGLGVEPDRHSHTARPAFVVIPAADAVHVLPALAAGNFFAGPIHRPSQRVLIPGRHIREVFTLPGPFHQPDQDQHDGDYKRPKRHASTTSQLRHRNPFA